MENKQNNTSQLKSNATSSPNHNKLAEVALQLSTDVIFSLNQEGCILFVNAAAKRQWGYEPEELIGHKFEAFLVLEERAKLNAAIAASIQNANTTTFQLQVICKNGLIGNIKCSGLWDPLEHNFNCVAQSTIGRAYQEPEFSPNLDGINRALSVFQIGQWKYDIQNKVHTASAELYNLYGLNRQENPIISRELFLSLVHPQDVASVLKHIEAVYHYPTYSYEHRLVKPTGEIVYLLQLAEVIRGKEGVLKYVHGITKDITQIKTAQIQIEQSQKKLIATLESLWDGFFSVDYNWTVTYWNRKAEALLGKSRSDILGKNLWEQYPEAMNLKFYLESVDAAKKGSPINFEEFYPPLQMWLEVGIFPSDDEISVYFKDITQRKLKEQERQQFQETIENQHHMMVEVLEQMQDAFMTITLEGKMIYWNKEAEEICNLPRESVLGKTLWELYPGIENTPFYSAYQRLISDGKSIQEEAYSPFTQKWIKLHAYKTALGISVFFRDTTEARKAEEELHKLSLIAKQTSNAVSILGRDMRIQWVNEAYTHLYGYAFGEIIGRRPNELVQVPQEEYGTLALLYKSIEEGQPIKYEMTCFTRNNKKLLLEIDAQPVLDNAGKVLYYFVIKTDITEQRKREGELRRLSLVAQKTVNAVTLVELDKKISWVNEAFTRMFGYTAEEAIGSKTSTLLLGPESDPTVIQQMVESFLKGQSFKGEILGYTKSNEKVWLETYGQPLYEENGKILRYFLMHTNITERKNFELELERQQKEITAAVITAQERERAQVGRELHDNVNQVLTSVKLYQDLILSGVGNQEELVIKSSQLLQSSINEIRNLSKRLSAPTLGNIKLKDSVIDLVETVGATNKFSAEVDVSAVEELEVDQELHLAVYRILQEQLTNILRYADASHVTVVLDFIDGNLVMKIIDNGNGFDVRKKSGGIGITNMKQRAESLNGRLNINSAPGLGCVLLVEFPLMEP